MLGDLDQKKQEEIYIQLLTEYELLQDGLEDSDDVNDLSDKTYKNLNDIHLFINSNKHDKGCIAETYKHRIFVYMSLKKEPIENRLKQQEFEKIVNNKCCSQRKPKSSFDLMISQIGSSLAKYKDTVDGGKEDNSGLQGGKNNDKKDSKKVKNKKNKKHKNKKNKNKRYTEFTIMD